MLQHGFVQGHVELKSETSDFDRVSLSIPSGFGDQIQLKLLFRMKLSWIFIPHNQRLLFSCKQTYFDV